METDLGREQRRRGSASNAEPPWAMKDVSGLEMSFAGGRQQEC